MINLKNLNKGLKWIIIPLVALAALGVVVLFFMQSQEITIKEDMYQYFSGIRFDYLEKTILAKDTERTLLKNNGTETPLDSTPLYYAKKDRLILPSPMTYMNPATNKLARMDYFTEIYSGGGLVHAQRGTNSFPIAGGFAFDGKDTYLFLEPMKVMIKNEETIVNPLSYVTVTYNREVNLYLYGEENFVHMPLPSMGFTAVAHTGYSINLNTDILVREDGSEQLIFNKPELLTPLEKVLSN